MALRAGQEIGEQSLEGRLDAEPGRERRGMPMGLDPVAAGPSHRADEHVLGGVLELDELDDLDVVPDRLEQLRARRVGHLRGEPLAQETA